MAIALSLVLSRVHTVLAIPALLLGGLAVGPHGAGVLRHEAFLDSAGDIGLVLLLFYTALFSPPAALRRGGRIALPLAMYDLVLNFAVAYWIGALFQWDLQGRLILAGVLTTSSTGAVLKILTDEGRLLRREGNVLVALLWIEDLAFIGYYLFLSGRHQVHGGAVSWTLALSALAFAAFLGWVFMSREVVWRIPHRETLAALVTGLGLVGAYLGSQVGLPHGAAAFTTGLVLAGSRGATFVQREVPWLRESAAATFFLAFGATLDPAVARDAVPVALLSVAGLLLTTFVFLPQVARLLGLRLTESLVLGTSLLARGGKSASFARLGSSSSPAAPQILAVSGFLTALLTPAAAVAVRAILWARARRAGRAEALERREVLSQITRRILAPGEFGQRHLVSWWERVALAEWFLLPLLLGVLAALLPYPWRAAPLVLGLAALGPAYRAASRYFGTVPGAPGTTYAARGRGLPRLEAYLPALLLAPCLLALVLPLAAPAAHVLYPAVATLTLGFILALPWLVHPRRSPGFGGVRVTRGRVSRLRLAGPG